MVNDCDVCGAKGYVKELVICSHCKNVFRHIYCMKDSSFKVPWHCDDCPQSLNMVQIQAENMPDNKVSNAEDNNRIKALLPLGNEDQFMANKVTSKDNILVKNTKNDKRRSLEVSGCTRQTNKRAANPVQEKQLATRRKSTSDLGHTLPLQKMAPLPNPINYKEKLANYHDQPCWKGTFEILDGCFFIPPFQGLRAHLSCDVNPKVTDLCKILPEKLKFKELPLSKIWPQIFMLEPPNTDDVALYFFCDPGRPRDKYIRFIQRLDSRERALKAKMKDARLLLFSSKKLPINSQNTKIGSYLWGIVHFSKPKVLLENTNAKCTNIISETKKQTMFELSNIPPAKRFVDIIVNPKTNVPKPCLVKKQTENIPQVASLGKQENEADCTLNRNIPPGFSKKSPKVRFDARFEKLKKKVDYYTDVDDTDLPPGFSNLPSEQQMNAQLQNDCEKGNVVKNKDVINKASNMDCHEDLIVPNIGAPLGITEKRSKNEPLEATKATNCISKLINGTEDKGFIKDEGHVENIGAPPGFPEIAVSSHFVHPTKCNGSCLQGVKNGNRSVVSDVKVKVNMKSETLEYSAMHVVSEPCREGINFVRPNFGQSSLSKDATSTMNKCQKVHVVSAEAADCSAKSDRLTKETKSTRSSPLTGQCFKTHCIIKNPALHTPPLVKNKGSSSSVGKYSTPNAERAKDNSSKAINPQSVSEVKRILLEVKKQRELKRKN